MGHFLKDLEDSKVAVDVVKKFLKKLHKGPYEVIIADIEKERQAEGDIEVTSDSGISYRVEIKYDKMAQKTGNLCFETHNKKGKLTGISSTKAEEVFYVVPGDKGFTLYMFLTKELKAYLFDTANVSKFRSVNGGDRFATCMLLAKREVIEEDGVAYRVEQINAKV
jgi:hypothetical protein